MTTLSKESLYQNFIKGDLKPLQKVSLYTLYYISGYAQGQLSFGSGSKFSDITIKLSDVTSGMKGYQADKNLSPAAQELVPMWKILGQSSPSDMPSMNAYAIGYVVAARYFRLAFAQKEIILKQFVQGFKDASQGKSLSFEMSIKKERLAVEGIDSFNNNLFKNPKTKYSYLAGYLLCERMLGNLPATHILKTHKAELFQGVMDGVQQATVSPKAQPFVKIYEHYYQALTLSSKTPE